MLFLAKQHVRSAVLVMLGLLVVSNAWAGVRGIALSDTVMLDLASVAAMVLGLTLVASIDSVIFLGSWIIGFHPFLDSFKSGYSRLFGHISLAAIFAGGLLAALGEETFFRGILQREWGILPAAMVFALAHAGRGLKLFTVWALLEGLVFGWLYQLTGNLLVPMIVHGVHDSAGMFFGRYLYGRFIPPAATLSDWLRALSGLAGPVTPPATAQARHLPVMAAAATATFAEPVVAAAVMETFIEPVTPAKVVQAQVEPGTPSAAQQALEEPAAPKAEVQAHVEPAAPDAANTIEPASVQSKPTRE